MQTLVCSICASEWQWPVGRGRKPATCDDCCTPRQASYRRINRLGASVAERRGMPPRSTVCAHCEGDMPAGCDSRLRYCGALCKRRAMRARQTRVRRLLADTRACLNCGAGFDDRRMAHSRYCNQQCRQEHRNSSPEFREWKFNYELTKRYGISASDWRAMFAKQGKRCANQACRTSVPGGHGWHVDHCHDTGAVRGILCHYCNVAAGNARDSADVLRGLADYLEMPRQLRMGVAS